MKNEEYHEQCAVAQYLQAKYPSVIFNADVGGAWTKNIVIALKNKRMGHQNGFPDLFIYEPRGIYHGLAIEMKRKKGGILSAEQYLWQGKLRDRNYKAEVCHGFEEAKKVIDEYLRR